jgi:hypothetical protein
MSETELSKQIRKALTAIGVWVVRLQSSGRRGPRSVATGEPGFPDLWTPYGLIEVKTEKGKLSHEQERWHERARAEGLNVATVRSVQEAVDVVSGWRASWRRAS